MLMIMDGMAIMLFKSVWLIIFFSKSVNGLRCLQNAPYQQICPTGEICGENQLNCFKSESLNLDYCLCPSYHNHHDNVSCDLNAFPVHVCPGGHICSDILACDSDGICTCPPFSGIDNDTIHNEIIHNEIIHNEIIHNEIIHNEIINNEIIHNDDDTGPVQNDNILSVDDIDLTSVHCNPYTLPKQFCPNGQECNIDSLLCKKDITFTEIYCICPPYDPYYPYTPFESHLAHCNPNSNHIEICQSGYLCTPSLHCKTHKFDHTAVHCNPNTFPTEICPNGGLCNRELLECVFSEVHGDIEYCICPSYSRKHDNDKYPDIDYCICPSTVHKYSEPHPDNNPHSSTHISNLPKSHHPNHYYSETHCNPNSQFQQICSTGTPCVSNFLECKHDEYLEIEYCICPHANHRHQVFCDPTSEFPQYCPSGHLCSFDLLDCFVDKKDYCVCPQYHEDYNTDEHEVYCNPHAEYKQICPNGHECNLNDLDCKKDNDRDAYYCLCPPDGHIHLPHELDHSRVFFTHQHKVICIPHSDRIVICPSGHLCSPQLLECIYDNHRFIYCLCPPL